MKINYNILWVEDDASWYKTTCELFSDNLEEQGFNLVPKRCVNFDEVKEINKDDGLKKFDILLIDFTLRNSLSGDEIINYLRSIEIFTDVIFYSSAVEDVRASMHRLGLEGVYSSDRKGIETKFEIVFNTTIKKIQEINSMRGLVVGETSELDVIIEELSIHIALKILNLPTNELDKIVNFYINDFLVSRPVAANKNYTIQGFANYFNQIEASRKWGIFRDLLKRPEFKEDQKIQAFLKINSTYLDEVINIRNKFAHSKSIEENGKTLLKGQIGKEHFEYDDDKFIKIRSNLKKHSDNFENILSHFQLK